MRFFRPLALGAASLTLAAVIGCGGEEASPPPPPPDPDAAAAAAASANEAAKPAPKAPRGSSGSLKQESSGGVRDPAMGPG